MHVPDCFPGDIVIGGRITRTQWERLVEAETWLASFDPVTKRDESGMIDFDEHLHLHDPDAAYGHFEALEAVLQGEGIPYDRNANAAYEYDGEEASFRPGMDGELVAPGSQDGGGIMVEAEAVADYLARRLSLEEVLAEPEAPNGLRLVCLRRDQPLPPFEFVEGDDVR